MGLNELLTAKIDLHCHCSNCSFSISTILYAIWMQAALTSALHSRYQPDRIRSLSPCLLEGISSPYFLLTSPLQVHQHEKKPLKPQGLCGPMYSVFVWQHNSLPCKKAYPMHRQLEVTLTPVTQFKASSVWLFDS